MNTLEAENAGEMHEMVSNDNRFGIPYVEVSFNSLEMCMGCDR